MQSIYKLGRHDSGTIFEMGGFLFKTIDKDLIDHFIEFSESDCYKELSNSKTIIETTIAIVGGEYYFKQKKLDLISYPREWSINMLVDASNLILYLCNILKKHGYYIVDCHGYNIIFDRGKPIIVDIGGIRKDALNNKFPVAPLLEYYVSYTIPFYIWLYCGSKLGKSSLPGIGNFIAISDYLSLKHPLMRSSLSSFFAKFLYVYINFITLGYKKSVQNGRSQFYAFLVCNPVFQYTSLLFGKFFLRLAKIKRRKLNSNEYSYDFSAKCEIPKVELYGNVAEVCYSRSITLLDPFVIQLESVNSITIISNCSSCDIFRRRIIEENKVGVNLVNTDVFSAYTVPGELPLNDRIKADYLIYSGIDLQAINEILKYSNRHIFEVLTSFVTKCVYFIIDPCYIPMLPSDFLKDMHCLDNFKVIWTNND